MSLIFRDLIRVTKLAVLCKRPFSLSACHRKTFEPDYLDCAGEAPPTYLPMNIQIKGYDFPILESFQRYIHNLAENMGIDVQDSWATPPDIYAIQTFVPEGTHVKEDYKLNVFERNIQITSMRSIDAPLLIDTIRTATPPGVTVTLLEHTEEEAGKRYIPDPFIMKIRAELDELEGKKEEKKQKSLEKKALREAAKKTLI